jgi:hypothetical protein
MNNETRMQYWLEGTSEPLTLRQIFQQRDRITPTTRCAALGAKEWKPIIEVIPSLFEDSPPFPVDANSSPVQSEPEVFSRYSGWVVCFYILAAASVVMGIVLAVLTQSVMAILSGLASAVGSLFLAFLVQVLVDIRWLLSRKTKE